MDLLPTEEQQQIVDSAKHFLEREFPLAAALQLPAGESRVRREELAQFAELGWFGIGLEEDHGGVGYGLSEELLLFVELGRALMPPSLLCSTLGARLAARSGLEPALTDILEGRCKIAAAVARTTGAATIGTTISGDFLAFEAADADLLLVADGGGAALVNPGDLVPTGTQACIDPTLTASTLRAENTAAAAYLPSNAEDIFHRGALLCAALLLGIAEATLERSVAYAGEREQYGKPIGAFQSIKHYCADMFTGCESVRAMLYHAGITFAQGKQAGRFDLHTVKSLATNVAQCNANTAVQIHGGMGYTQEMDIHLFVKRAQLLAELFGGERHHLRELLAQPTPE